MKKHIINFLKGILLGFVCVATPGVSGGTIAVIIGLFDAIIENGNNLFKHIFKKSWWPTFLFFVSLGLGIILGAFIGSKVVTFTFNKYPLIITMILAGFIIGSFSYLFGNVKEYYNKKSNIITFIIVFALALSYTFFLSSGSNVSFESLNFYKGLMLIIMGIVTIATMIIPGISGNIFLMAFGYYYPLNDILSNITVYDLSYTLPILLLFIIGCIIGAILIVKLIKYLLTKFNEKTNMAIFAFVVSSPIIMVKLCLIDNNNFVFNYVDLIIGSVLFVIALIGSFYISKLAKRSDNV